MNAFREKRRQRDRSRYQREIAPAPEKPNRLMSFLNAPITLWLLTTGVVGVFTTTYTTQKECRQQVETASYKLAGLREELQFRFRKIPDLDAAKETWQAFALDRNDYLHNEYKGISLAEVLREFEHEAKSFETKCIPAPDSRSPLASAESKLASVSAVLDGDTDRRECIAGRSSGRVFFQVPSVFDRVKHALDGKIDDDLVAAEIGGDISASDMLRIQRDWENMKTLPDPDPDLRPRQQTDWQARALSMGGLSRRHLGPTDRTVKRSAMTWSINAWADHLVIKPGASCGVLAVWKSFFIDAKPSIVVAEDIYVPNNSLPMGTPIPDLDE